MDLPLVIEPAQLARHLDNPNLLIVDLSKAETYQQGHIPGALNIDPARLNRGEAPVPNKLPTPVQLSELCSEMGLTADKHVIVYDDLRGLCAGRMIWTLHLLGHDNCSLLNGHLTAWQHAGLELEAGINTATPSCYEAQVLHPELLADVDTILENLDGNGASIWDARTPAEFSGEKIVNAKKGGHIPGAVNYEWQRALDEQGRLRDDQEILAELAELGLTPDQEIITHCQTHRRSGFTYVLARHLGFNQIRAYDGSWFEWGNLDNTPVEQ